MANKASARKALRQTKKRTALNDAKRKRIRETMKAIEKAVKEGNKDIQELVVKAQKALDKATKTNVIHKNKAARLKSQLSKRVKK